MSCSGVGPSVTFSDIYCIANSIDRAYEKEHRDCGLPVLVIGEGGLISTSSRQLGFEVREHCLPWAGDMLCATVRRYEDKGVILYSKSLNACWARYAICKELMHLLCGDEKNFCKDPVTLVSGLVNGLPPGLSDEIDVEVLCLHGAIEMLIPPSKYDRLYEMRDVQDMDDFTIASRFKVPEKVINWRLMMSNRERLDLLKSELYVGT